ncbi:ATP-binding protein [Geomonas nitrogeniifigens]|uniref:DnaA/Hda family protein n=1 Tax=Geomonas diazotrophica TaxID=2843197 RepID=UPI001C2C3845|nr:DnaA/Hda family protein [Geomonas nitrogeniifigens]QXE87356.1 ATP-binding protein [Geomonas nitrogeniifigens]
MVVIGRHQEGFEKEERLDEAYTKVAEFGGDLREYRKFKEVAAILNPELCNGAFTKRPCRRKLRYIGEDNFPEVERLEKISDASDFFVYGAIYYSVDFNGATYAIEGYPRRIGRVYFEWLKGEDVTETSCTDHLIVSTKEKGDTIPARKRPHFAQLTFENFGVLDCNRFAVSCALAIANGIEGPQQSLLVHGGPGLGKTHLVNAIRHRLEQTAPDVCIRHMSGGSFLEEMIQALRRKKMASFRQDLLRADLLLFDDIDVLEGREASQEEFTNTLEALASGGKPVVLTCARPLEQFAVLNPRLISRLKGMINIRLEPPAREDLPSLLKRLAEKLEVLLPAAALEAIAELYHNDLRELEGMITCLDAYRTHVGPLTEDVLSEVLKGYGGSRSEVAPLEEGCC